MSLKFKYAAKADVPAEFAGLYAERDGAFFLDVEGAVESARLAEFRQTNINQAKELEHLRGQYADLDPATVKELLADKQKLDDAAALKAGGIDALVAGRVKATKAELQAQLDKEREERERLSRALSAITIDQAVVAEATKRGLRPTALEDLTGRARRIFALVDGVPRAVEADGKTVKTGKDGVTPLAVSEWVEGLVTAAPHLFEGNAGGGAAGSGSGGAGGVRVGKNPFAKETWNLTEQMRLMKRDPATAARLKAAA